MGNIKKTGSSSQPSVIGRAATIGSALTTICSFFAQRPRLNTSSASNSVIAQALVTMALLTVSFAGNANDQESLTSSAPANQKIVQIGELRVQVTSLRVSAPSQRSGDSIATLSIQIENTGSRPIALDYQSGTGNVTDDRGYKYPEYPAREEISGLPRADSNHADASMVIDPGARVGAQLRFTRFLHEGQTVGSVYDFVAEFASYEDLGQGRIKKLRTYPISITNLQRAPMLSGALNDSAGRITDAIGSIFKHR